MNLQGQPFYLSKEDEEWVYQTLSGLSAEEKLAQLLCPCVQSMDDNSMNHLLSEVGVGGVMLRPFSKEGLKEFTSSLKKKSKLPLLIAANLENGGSGVIQEGTLFSNPLGIAATGDKEEAYHLGKIACSQAKAIGVNWAFAPIIDIDWNYHNPITNVRTFGSDPDTVLLFAKEYLKAAKEEKVIPTIKHFPGDGVDERDQHLLTSVNSLSYEDYMKSYGRNYQELIREGVMTIMVGHIAQPNVAKHCNPDLSNKDCYLPASLSKTLINEFLRKDLGFNGLCITDSTLMVGYLEKMPRKKALSASINAGIDMILFSRNIDEDYGYLKDEYRSGDITEERLNEAVTRILALKAKMRKEPDYLVDVDSLLQNETYHAWTENCAKKAITLVKDNSHLLPLSPKKTKRIFLNVIENKPNDESLFAKEMKSRLEQEGFEVTLLKRDYPEITPSRLFSGDLTPRELETLSELGSTTDAFTSQYDLGMILLDEETASNATVLRVNWNVLFGMGNDIPWYSGEFPLVVASFSNPYHLLDIPMADCYINCYTKNKETIDAFFEKIMGRDIFQGVSPVDPFCHHGDTEL